MYLLILGGATNSGYPFSFTFHNVSINSRDVIITIVYMILFTFHNVSINSERDETPSIDDKIYIP